MNKNKFAKALKISLFKKGLLLGSLAIISFNLTGQVYYTYDANGNRTQMSISSARHLNPNGSSNNNSSDTTKDSIAGREVSQYGLSVYPNPTSRSITLSISNLKSGEDATIYLSGSTGNILYTTKTSVTPFQINMQSYAAGVYYVKVVIDKHELYYRVVKTQ